MRKAVASPVPRTIRRTPTRRRWKARSQKEYIHLLLLELMNGGQFSPYDAFWLSQWIPRWYRVVLRSKAVRAGVRESRRAIISSSTSTAPRGS